MFSVGGNIMSSKNELIIFNDDELTIEVNVSPESDTVWLTQEQMSILFDTSRSTISYHITNIFNRGELDRGTSVEIFDRSKIKSSRPPMYYNLDVILSVGYRVNSRRGITFRKWSTAILKDYAVRGYAINSNKISYEEQLQLIKVLERSSKQLEAAEILSVLEHYTLALQLLDDYDHKRIKRPSGRKTSYELTYAECKDIIQSMKVDHETDVFGVERGGEFQSSIKAIYQTFEGKELYPTLEEKAAHLLYFLVKNHGFADGNKRIAAALFVYFLDKNDALLRDGMQVIDNKTLVALTIMLAESDPSEKDLLVNLIMILMKI